MKNLPKSFYQALTIMEERHPGTKAELKALTELKTRYSKRLIAEFKLMIIAEVINDGWIPDFSNRDQRKYYPWFRPSYTGRVLVYSSCGSSRTNAAAVGARLCYVSEELAEYAGETFSDIYSDYLLG